MLPPPPRSTLFPYTTLFRSERAGPQLRRGRSAARPGRLHRRAGRAALQQLRPEDDRARAVSPARRARGPRSEEHTSELQSQSNLVCRLLLEKKKKKKIKKQN